MGNSIWPTVLDRLAFELSPQQFNTWIRPLRADVQEGANGLKLRLSAPNRFVLDWVRQKFLIRIEQLLQESDQSDSCEVELVIGANGYQNTVAEKVPNEVKPPSHRASPSRSASNTQTRERFPVDNGIDERGISPTRDSHLKAPEAGAFNHRGDRPTWSRGADRLSAKPNNENTYSKESRESHARRKQVVDASSRQSNSQSRSQREIDMGGTVKHKSNLNVSFTFDSFVEGKSNQLARAAAMQVADNPGGAYNPLFLYGGVGLGKTHLMHAIGNQIMLRSPNAKVVYLHSERFVADMVKALQINAINEFKRFYRTVDALLIDDIQFFAGKDRSQEEFFHTFNALLEGGQQMILTSDRYPKEITDVEERLKSRFGWGLTVAVEPPELETRVAILMKKADETRINLPHEAAFFIAKRIRSNVRELEGALKRVVANAHFTGQPITLEFVRESLKDLLAIQDKQVSVDNIQKTVAEYFKIKIGDILSKRRSRSVARPRQVAMALSKELTNHSLPEIGDAFGGRDHTTVLHACRKIRELCEEDCDLKDDYRKLLQMLTG